MSDRFRYAPNPRTRRRSVHLRRFQDPILHEKFYAFLKHKAQARFRGELYQLTWAQWQRLWPQKFWNRRGRKPNNLRLTQIDPAKGWHVKNCCIRPHSVHMREVNRQRRTITTTTEA